MTHLYVCVFSSGHIKVGRSIDPRSRIAQHAERVACIGVELVDHRSFVCVGSVVAAEAELILRCSNQCDQRLKSEWFSGLAFDAVCAWAGEIANSLCTAAAAEPLQKAIDLCGGVGKLAAAIGVGQSVISNWRARCTVPSASYCVAIERATGGAVTRRDLRPDDWQSIWPELATEPERVA